jgi:hypothetical protein
MPSRLGCATACSTLIDSCCNAVRHNHGLFVLPCTDHTPPRLAKRRINRRITLSIPLDLRTPVRGVRAWRRVVIWAPMPEAAVDEHSYTRAGEKQVRGPRQRGERSCGDPEPQPEPMRCAADRAFGSRIALAIPQHDRTHGRSGRPGGDLNRASSDHRQNGNASMTPTTICP